jgi:SAM-dependent methyltransferase
MSIHGYHSREYWDAAYAQLGDQIDDWLQSYEVLRPCLSVVKPEHSILILGCGNSPLGEQMYDEGYRRITSIDFSPPVIALMRARAAGRAGLVYEVMDARDLRFAEGSFDAVIDKGTFDAIVCTPDDHAAVSRACAEVVRVLGPGGVFVSVSLAPPRRRLPLLKHSAWTGEAVHTVPKTRILESDDPEANLNWVYVLSK